jgi:hypothetical protein
MKTYRFVSILTVTTFLLASLISPKTTSQSYSQARVL